jgi:hypothetical protein
MSCIGTDDILEMKRYHEPDQSEYQSKIICDPRISINFRFVHSYVFGTGQELSSERLHAIHGLTLLTLLLST